MAELFKNEKKIRRLGIPTLALLITVGFGVTDRSATPQDLIVSLVANTIITFLYWQGNVSIFNLIRNHYPFHLAKRLLLTLLISFSYNLLVSFSLLFIAYFFYDIPFSLPVFLENFLLGMIFTLIIGSIYEIIFYFSKWKESVVESEKLRRDFINAEYETLKNQVNPHFLFNSMNALSSLVHSDPDKAEQFIEEFSKIYRYILDKKDEVVVRLNDELDFVRSFLFLQEIRFGKSLRIQITIPAQLLEYFVPPVSLQLLVENAIKHNIVLPEMPLHISIYQEGLTIVVKNNLQKRGESVNSTRVGLKNLQAKYKIISDQVPEFIVDENYYIAKIPLLTEEQNESTYR